MTPSWVCDNYYKLGTPVSFKIVQLYKPRARYCFPFEFRTLEHLCQSIEFVPVMMMVARAIEWSFLGLLMFLYWSSPSFPPSPTLSLHFFFLSLNCHLLFLRKKTKSGKLEEAWKKILDPWFITRWVCFKIPVCHHGKALSGLLTCLWKDSK